MKYKLKIISILISLLTLITLTSCSNKPNGDPKSFLEGYLQDIKNRDYTSAYGKLCSVSQKDFTEEDYFLFQRLSVQVYETKSTTISNPVEAKNKSIKGTLYNLSIQYTLSDRLKNLYSLETETSTYTKNVVIENGKWRIYWGDGDIKKAIGYDYYGLGLMYLYGNTKSQNYNEAIINLKNALKYDSTLNNAYFALGEAYHDVMRYEDSLAALNIFITTKTDDKILSDAYNIIGLDYEGQHLFSSAKSMFQVALQINPDNENAKTNMALLP